MIERFVQVETGFPSSKLLDRALDQLAPVGKNFLIGCFVRLWSAALDARTRGQVGDRSNRWIEEAAGWEGEPGRFAEFVREHHLDEDGVIRDWLTKYGKLDLDRQKATVLKRDQRARVRQGADSPEDVHRTEDGQTADRPGIPSIYQSVSQSVDLAKTEDQKPVGREEFGPSFDPLVAVLDEANLSRWLDEEFKPDEANMIAGFLRSQRSPLPVALTLAHHLRDEECPPAALAVAVREYAALGEPAFKARHFAGFVKRARSHVAQASARAMGRSEERFITGEDVERERAKREEAETERMLNDFRRDHADVYLTLQYEAEAKVSPNFKGQFRPPVVQAELARLVRQWLDDEGGARAAS
jgi:hypothetical protein